MISWRGTTDDLLAMDGFIGEFEMFWTDNLRQRGLFGPETDEYFGSHSVGELVQFAKEHWPNEDCNFHRMFAFLTHRASKAFLGPLFEESFGTIDAAKEPCLEWFKQLGSLETFARSTRYSETKPNPARETRRKVPDWYLAYCKCNRFMEMKARAETLFSESFGEITCLFNARHTYEVMHHRDYARLGEVDEWRYLVPLCHECHEKNRIYGPSLPRAVPSSVEEFIQASEPV